MTITREQVADLQPGDVVELSDEAWGDQVVMRGPVDADKNWLCLGPFILRYADGGASDVPKRSLTVVSHAPRPLYVNHPRTEPVAGDVVRDADGDDPTVWACHEKPRDYALPWLRLVSSGGEVDLDEMPTRLRLLVDGETGQVVP